MLTPDQTGCARCAGLNQEVTGPITELPADPALPGLVAIRATGLAGAVPTLGIEESSVEIMLRGYTPGSRVTLEVRSGQRRFAIKAYAEDPAPEAALYEALAGARLVGQSTVRVPPLLAWERDLRILVIGWLEGPTAHSLVETGRGRRAGELAACWLRCAASLPVKIGPTVSVARMLGRAGKWGVGLSAADPPLGVKAAALIEKLAVTLPKECAPRLIHGTLYDRHVLDLADGPGLIDWQRFGQGPAELDAGMFLATIWRIGLLHDRLVSEATRAEAAFLEGVADILDMRALAWHRAVALLRLAHKRTHRKGASMARAEGLLGAAMRMAEAAG